MIFGPKSINNGRQRTSRLAFSCCVNTYIELLVFIKWRLITMVLCYLGAPWGDYFMEWPIRWFQENGHCSVYVTEISYSWCDMSAATGLKHLELPTFHEWLILSKMCGNWCCSIHLKIYEQVPIPRRYI